MKQLFKDYQEILQEEEHIEYVVSIYHEACKRFNYEDVLELYMQHKIPANFRNETLNRFSDFYYWCREKIGYFTSFELRDIIIPLAGFTVVDKQLVQDIESWLNGRRVLEVMSGTGCLAYALQEAGITIKATDTYDDEGLFEYNEPWLDVEQLNCIEAVEKYGSDYDVLLCSWPRDYYPMIELIDKMREVNPEMVMIYIGELEGGCCADYTFFEYAKMVDRCQPIYLKSYTGIHDNVIIVK